LKSRLIAAAAFSMMLLSTGCQGHTITKEQAISTVKSQYEKNNDFGKIKIISVVHKYGKYVVKWERKSNCEAGTDYVNDSTGKITYGLHQIC
jgi:hypothetical protein